MPAHRKQFAFDTRFLASQKLVQFFLNRGFWLLLEREYRRRDVETLPRRMVRADNLYRTRHELESLQDGLAFAGELLTKLNAYLTLHAPEKVTLQGEWNYLGRDIERQAYLARITEMFWSHQDRDSVKAHPEFAHMLKSPWLFAARAPEFGFPIPAPADTFTPTTIEFVESLMLTLPGWELSPYLLTNSTSNFHWRLLVNHEPLITGTITKSESGVLVHETEFSA